MSGDCIIIVLRLPMDIHRIDKVLNVLANEWPTSKIDLNGGDGWRIEVGPDDPGPRKDPS